MTPTRARTDVQNIFVSYGRDDRHRAVQLVDALERQGFSVWWDRDLAPGQNWQRELESAVQHASCVVVLWTRDSVSSDWVREEASFAREQGKLIPALLDDVEIPVPFRLIQTADLRDWHGEEEHKGFRELASGVRAHRGAPSTPVEPKPRLGKAWLGAAWIFLPTVIVALIALVLMNWPAPTEVDIDVIARSLQFRGRGTDTQVLLESAPAPWLALQGFDEIRLSPENVWIADPAKYDLKDDKYPANAWSSLPAGQRLVLRPAGGAGSAVTIRPLAKADGSLILGPIFAGSSDITLSSPEKDSLSVDVRGQKVDGDVPLPEEFRIDADRCVREGAPPSNPASTITLKVRLSESSRFLEYFSSASGMRFAVGYSAERKGSFFRKGGFAVDQVRFLNQRPKGEAETTLAGGGEIRYPRYPAAAPVALTADDSLSLGNLREFYVREISRHEDGSSLRIRLGGIAGKISSGLPGRVLDRRLTYFNHLRLNPTVAALFTILAWVVPTLIAARNLFRDLRGKRTGQPV